jgi:hypothetical protein
LQSFLSEQMGPVVCPSRGSPGGTYFLRCRHEDHRFSSRCAS